MRGGMALVRAVDLMSGGMGLRGLRRLRGRICSGTLIMSVHRIVGAISVVQNGLRRPRKLSIFVLFQYPSLA